MTDIKALLDDCPFMAGYHVDDLPAGMAVGVFPQGVQKLRQDVTGNKWVTKCYLLRCRTQRGASWVADMTRWALEQGLAVDGGKMTSPAGDGFGTYELRVYLSAECRMQNAE